MVEQVKLNGGQDFINLDETLVDLKLGPEVLEVPVPRFFREDRAKVNWYMGWPQSPFRNMHICMQGKHMHQHCPCNSSLLGYNSMAV